MQIDVDLLGIVNEGCAASAVLQRKYIVRVTAEQIAQWLH